MTTALTKIIIAVVTTDKDTILGGGAPIIYAKNKKQQEQMAVTIARITEGVVHELDNGLKIIVKH